MWPGYTPGLPLFFSPCDMYPKSVWVLGGSRWVRPVDKATFETKYTFFLGLFDLPRLNIVHGVQGT